MEKPIRGWGKELVRAHRRMGDLFPRSEVRERSLAYLEGLLSHCERKNNWQVAEWAGEAAPYGMQYLLDRARWDVARNLCPVISSAGISMRRIAASTALSDMGLFALRALGNTRRPAPVCGCTLRRIATACMLSGTR